MMKKIGILFPLLLVFAAVCGGAQGLRPKNYIQHTEMRSWKDAQAHCRETNTDLVTINSDKENQDFYFYYGWGWIGLYREDSDSEWKWSRTDEITKFTNWKYGYPKNGEDCAFKYSLMKWMSDRCDVRRSFMCYDETLVLVKKMRTWEQALKHCRALEPVDSSKPATAYQNHRYDLATLLTPDDHVYAREKAQEATTNEVWTGLRYLAGQWLWVGGEPVQYEEVIQSCQSQRFCGVLVKNRTTLFETRQCDEKRNFLCYKRF
ncbi:hypothetical protein VZT92_008076 [Zoarces viviparus]|uniref:C-type lectin domain-containing protein n=1 Tax=Zoarces viviparus TaxID=48416 RepID=A0AAW1FLP2_ZOAVI